MTSHEDVDPQDKLFCYLIVPLVESAAAPTGHVKVKVGISGNLHRRLTELQASESLRYVAISGRGRTLETELKREFKPYLAMASSKEWFYLQQKVYDTLLSNATCEWETDTSKIHAIMMLHTKQSEGVKKSIGLETKIVGIATTSTRTRTSRVARGDDSALDNKPTGDTSSSPFVPAEENISKTKSNKRKRETASCPQKEEKIPTIVGHSLCKMLELVIGEPLGRRALNILFQRFFAYTPKSWSVVKLEATLVEYIARNGWTIEEFVEKVKQFTLVPCFIQCSSHLKDRLNPLVDIHLSDLMTIPVSADEEFKAECMICHFNSKMRWCKDKNDESLAKFTSKEAENGERRLKVFSNDFYSSSSFVDSKIERKFFPTTPLCENAPKMPGYKVSCSSRNKDKHEYFLSDFKSAPVYVPFHFECDICGYRCILVWSKQKVASESNFKAIRDVSIKIEMN